MIALADPVFDPQRQICNKLFRNAAGLRVSLGFWTPERDEELRRHAAAGLSASEIAVLLHTTQAAVRGRSRKLRSKVVKSNRWLKRLAAKKRNSASQLARRRSAHGVISG
jgi:hypothetical protein